MTFSLKIDFYFSKKRALFCGDCGTKLQLPVIPSLDEGKPVVRRRADSIGNDLTASYLVKTK